MVSVILVITAMIVIVVVIVIVVNMVILVLEPQDNAQKESNVWACRHLYTALSAASPPPPNYRSN